jgi:PAS domain-containing protein
MQDTLNNIITIILVATAIIVIFAIGYVAVILVGNQRFIREQNRRIAEIQKSEQRYKALFENSLAGMMKFNFQTWEFIDANSSLLNMFNCSAINELQNVFNNINPSQFEQITMELETHGTIDGMEIQFTTSNGINRRYLFSARKEESENIAHGVMIFVSANRMIG